MSAGAAVTCADADVVVCGGGLAGLTLARQLQIEQPQRVVRVLERQRRPLPEVSKVGESTVEYGAHYLTDYLGLGEHLDAAHIQKAGLRFFCGDARGPFESRPELGLSRTHEVYSYQIDRPRLETHLREQILAHDPSSLVEGARVEGVRLSAQAVPHEVDYRLEDEPSPRTVRARWVIDASGRRRLLPRLLGLTGRRRAPCSAAWFHLEGRWDVSDLVAPTHTQWHERVAGDGRYRSTVHLCGTGYWIWIIPLSSGFTSVGLVALEAVHAFETYRTPDLLKRWLEANEPAWADHIAHAEMRDFRVMRRYSHTSTRVFSPQRWACTGEAAVFADPYYSTGLDAIAMGNVLIGDLIRRDFSGHHDPQRVARHNRRLLAFDRFVGSKIQRAYPWLGDGVIQAARGVWDLAIAWGVQCPPLFSRAMVDDEAAAVLASDHGAGTFGLSLNMDALFAEWFEHRDKVGGRFEVGFFDYLSMPWLAELRRENLAHEADLAVLAKRHRQTREVLEALAHALFLLAVEDCFPERLGDLGDHPWLDAWRVTLSPSRWVASGMFSPATAPRDYAPILDSLRQRLDGPTDPVRPKAVDGRATTTVAPTR